MSSATEQDGTGGRIGRRDDLNTPMPWAFNHRILNSKEPSPILGDPIWDTFEVSLLPKKTPPVQFRFLRPVASLVASAKLWSRTCFHVLGRYDTACSPSHLGFRKAHVCVCVQNW